MIVCVCVCVCVCDKRKGLCDNIISTSFTNINVYIDTIFPFVEFAYGTKHFTFYYAFLLIFNCFFNFLFYYRGCSSY